MEITATPTTDFRSIYLFLDFIVVIWFYNSTSKMLLVNKIYISVVDLDSGV